MTVFGPDGREWSIARRPASASSMPAILRRGTWIVEATASDETRRWSAASRRVTVGLVTQIALALRTGAEGPPGELLQVSEVTAERRTRSLGANGSAEHDGII
jgi:hypothetical protein